jgi:hypothetical protein
MLSFRPYGRRGAVKLSDARLGASSFLKNFAVFYFYVSAANPDRLAAIL